MPDDDDAFDGGGSRGSRNVPVAVVGLGCLLPGAAGVDEFWSAVLNGRDLIRDVPEDRWLLEDYYTEDYDRTSEGSRDRTYARRGAFLGEVDFDPVAFGIPPRTLSAIDSTQLLALLVAEQTLADCRADRLSAEGRERVGVILGSGSLELMNHMAGRMQRPVWQQALREHGIEESRVQEICDSISAQYVPWQEDTFPGLLSNVVAGRVANRFDLHGANLTVDAACASSLAAVHSAVAELSLHRADLVLTGGVDTMNDITMFMCFTKTTALSRTGDCRPFSQDADGTVLGEGLAMLALKRLADAERDGDRIYAVVRGTGAASDGHGAAVYAPQAEGQVRALRRAYQAAGYGPDTVELVEAHGTGTRAGDAAEFAALRTVFDAAGRADRQWCALGSVKSQLGHTKYAAGAVGLLKAVLALHTGTLPPTIKAQRPNPDLGLPESPFYLNTRARPWIRPAGHPRRASVSGFGFGGSNFHVAVEEYTPAGRADRDAGRTAADVRGPSGPELLLLSADTAAEAVDRIGRLPSGAGFAEAARQAAGRFRPTDRVRLAVVADDELDARRKLDAAAGALAGASPEAVAALPAGCHLSTEPAAPGRLAFLFPGQGSQYVDMGAGLALRLPRARRCWDRMSEVDPAAEPLHRIVFPPPALTDAEQREQRRRLASTEWAQPALAVHSLALLEVLGTLGLRPDCVAGHSFGELTALHVAGVFDAGTLVRLARRRGEFVRAASEGSAGAMLVVRAGRDLVAGTLAATGVEDVWLANDNSPDQVVVSGSPRAVERLAAALADQGVSAAALDVSAAFHSPLVAPAAEMLSAELDGVALRPPALDVYGNRDAAVYPAAVDQVRLGIGAHLASPVRFREMVEAMYADGVRTFAEVGADDKLSRLVRDILGPRPHTAVGLDRRGLDAVTALYDGLARLAVAGVHFDPGAPAGPARPAGARAPRQAGAASVKISGKNHGVANPSRGGSAEVAAVAGPQSAPAPASYDTVVVAPIQPVQHSARRENAVDDLHSADILRSFDEFQRQTAQAHASFQQVLADSHREFLRTAEASFAALLGTGVADRSAWPESPGVQPGGSGYPDRRALDAPSSPPLAPPPEPVSAYPPANGYDLPPSFVDAEPEPPVTAHDDMAGDPGDRVALVLSVVAELTGYPAEVLSADMELEGHLGIDSIKKVEILSALRRRTGQAIGANTADLAVLRTLGDVAATLTGEDPPAAPAAAAAAVREPVPAAEGPPATQVARFAVRAVPSAPAGFTVAGLDDGLLAVLGNHDGIGESVARELTQYGVPAVVGDTVPADAHSVLYLGGLAECSTPQDAFAVHRGALAAARDFAARARTGGGAFITVQDTGGDFGLSGRHPDRAWQGGLEALVRTMAKELPSAGFKAIDCARAGRAAPEVAEAIVRELFHGGPDVVVGLRADGGRITLQPIPAEVSDRVDSPGPAAVGPESVVVVSGGARGITASAVLALGRAHRPKLALLGRTALTDEPEGLPIVAGPAEVAGLLAALRPTADRIGLLAEAKQIIAVREIRATMTALIDAGCEVRYLSVDVSDPAAVDKALQTVRAELGPVTGVVHGAGVLADGLVADTTDAALATVFATKVGGLQALLEATREDALTLLCLFSSVAGSFGNPGQSGYGAANAVLDHVASAERARRPGCLVRSIAWGPWRGGMVDRSLAERFAAEDLALLPIAAGADAFVAELGDAGADVDTRVVLEAVPGMCSHASDHATARSSTVRVSARTHPYLLDHRIGDQTILPMAVALEWLLRAAPSGSRPVSAVGDVRVLRKVALPHLAGEDGIRLHITAEPTRRGRLLSLTSADGTQHYLATGLSDDRPPRDWSAGPGQPVASTAFYDGRALFHGPMFQVLRTVDGVCGDGAWAVVVGAAELGWPEEPWRSDPAAVDGAFQLAVLWADRTLGWAALPMSVRECRVYRPGPLPGPARCVLRVSRTEESGLTCDLAILDADGGVRTEILGLELVRRPGDPT